MSATPLRVPFRDPADDRQPKDREIPRPTWRSPVLGIAAAVLLAVGVLAGRWLAQPGCNSYQEQLQEFQTLASQGKTDTVVGLADLALAKGDACKPARVPLAALRFAAAMQQVYNHPELGGEASVLAWREADSKAKAAGVRTEQRSPMPVFANSYNARMWPLARAAFLQAWGDHLVDPQDLQATGKYGASLFNWADMLLTRDSEDTHGQALLHTACAIDRGYGLFQGVACRTIRDRFGTDESKWPAPLADDPVLAAARVQ